MRKQQREAILALLEETYMGTETALNYSTPFELLVAVIMSAQCTDERVNKITARIFPKYNTPEKMGALSQEQLEEEIRDCGLFRSKAKNLLATCKMLTEEYNSVIPLIFPFRFRKSFLPIPFHPDTRFPLSQIKRIATMLQRFPVK